MELQGLSNAASRQVLQQESGVSASASLASAGCCNDAACNCVGGQQATQNVVPSQTERVQLSARGQQLSRQTQSEDGGAVQDVRALAGLTRLAQQALRAYQA